MLTSGMEVHDIVTIQIVLLKFPTHAGIGGLHGEVSCDIEIWQLIKELGL